MKFGKYNIEVIDTGLFGLDGGSMFGVVPKPLWQRAYDKGDEKNRIQLRAKPLLVTSDDRKILIDTGNGTKYDQKFIDIYNIDIEASDMTTALAPHGITPADITDVILTHLHFDHAGGATVIENGEIVPTFPNARYYVQKEQYDWALNPTEKDRASFMRHNYVPLKESGIMELLDGKGTLFDDFKLIPIHGHTKAMQMVKIEQDGESMLYCTDLCPTTAHLNYPFVMGYDNFPLTALEEKKIFLPIVYEEKTLLIFEHDAFVQAGRLVSTSKGFQLGDKIQITP